MESRLSRRTVILLLAVLVLVSVAVRYPLVEHERFQTDSYTMHYLSKSIVDNGYAKWTIHPLSYLGYYPLSYPSGVPFIIAEVSSLTGASIEFSVLLVNMMFGIMLCLGVFLMARLFITRDQFAILAVLFVILGARFVDTTYWNGSARGPLVVLMILTVFALYRAEVLGQRRLTVLGYALAAGCFVAHHMAVLLVLFGVSYVFASILANYLLPRVWLHRSGMAAAYTAVIGLSILVISLLYLDFWRDFVIAGSGQDALFPGSPNPLPVVLNVGVAYVHQVGFILLFALLAVPSLIMSSNLSAKTLFPLALVLAFLPLMSRLVYVSMLLAPFVAILGVYWFSRQYRKPRRSKAVTVLISLLIVGSFALNAWSVQRWNGAQYVGGYAVEVDSQVFSDAIYLDSEYAEWEAIANSKIFRMEFASLSDMEFLGSGIQLLLSDEVTHDYVRNNSGSTSAKFPMNLYVWADYTGGPEIDIMVETLMLRGVSGVVFDGALETKTGRYMVNHTNLVVLIDNDHPTNYINDYMVRSSPFTHELLSATWHTSSADPEGEPLASYLVYSTEQTSQYLFQLPF